jgi:hypothetical protein
VHEVRQFVRMLHHLVLSVEQPARKVCDHNGFEVHRRFIHLGVVFFHVVKPKTAERIGRQRFRITVART